MLYLSGDGAKSQHHRLIIAAVTTENTHPALAVKSMQTRDSSRLQTRCREALWLGSACVSPGLHFAPGFQRELRRGRDTALQTPLSHSGAQQPTTACLNAKRAAGAPPYALLQFTCRFTPSAGQITSQLSASDRSWAAAAPPPRCVAQRVGQPQIHRSLSLSSTVSPTKRYHCL